MLFRAVAKAPCSEASLRVLTAKPCSARGAWQLPGSILFYALHCSEAFNPSTHAGNLWRGLSVMRYLLFVPTSTVSHAH